MAIRVRDPDTDPDTDPDPYRGTGIRRALAEVCTVPLLLVSVMIPCDRLKVRCSHYARVSGVIYNRHARIRALL